MVDFQRVKRLLLWLVVGLYLGGFAAYASAQNTYPSVKKWYTQSADSGNDYSGPVQACTALAPLVGEVYYGTTGYYAGVTPPLYLDSYHYCSWRRYSSPTCPVGQYCGQNSGIKTLPRMVCPSGGTLSADQTTCTVSCPAGQSWNASLNQCQETCVAGSHKGYYSTGFQTSACINGCSYTRSASGNFSTCSGWTDGGGWSSCYLAQSGETCSTPNGSVSSGLPQCPVGQCPGTINGSPVCVPCTGKTDTQSSGTKTTTNADGSSTTTTTTTNTTSDGGSTTTTTTTNTTNTPAGGGTPTSTTTTDTETKPKDSFCIENPDSPLCKQSSFGGSCGSFSCDGDAIQCAMAREQHARNCTMFDTETAESTLGRQAAAGNDPQASNYPTAPGKVESINLSTAIDTSNPLASGCIADKQIAFSTFTLTLPFSVICPYLEFMGQIVLAFALLAAARITFSGV